jgi:hypothetical protein
LLEQVLRKQDAIEIYEHIFNAITPYRERQYEGDSLPLYFPLPLKIEIIEESVARNRAALANMKRLKYVLKAIKAD